MRTCLVLVGLLCAPVGCKPSESNRNVAQGAGSVQPSPIAASTTLPEPASASTSAPSRSVVGSNDDPSAARMPAASASETASAANAYSGKGVAKVGTVNVPREAHVDIWKKDKGDVGVGEVTATLEVLGKNVTGTLKGALGECIVSGQLDDGVLSARVDPKSPNELVAWTGVLTGKVDGKDIVAKVRVSDRTANRVREVELKLSP